MLSTSNAAGTAIMNPSVIIKTPPRPRSRPHSLSRYDRCFCCHIPDSPTSADDEQLVLAREPRRSKISRLLTRWKLKIVEIPANRGSERLSGIPRSASPFQRQVLSATSLAAQEHDVNAMVNCVGEDDMSMHAISGEDSLPKQSTTAEQAAETPTVPYPSMEYGECLAWTPGSLTVVEGRTHLVDAPGCHPSITTRHYTDVKAGVVDAAAWGEKETQCSDNIEEGVLDTPTWGEKDTTQYSDDAEEGLVDTTPCGTLEANARRLGEDVVMKDAADSKLHETTTDTTTHSPRTRTDSKSSPELTAARYGGDQPENTGCSAEAKMSTKNGGGLGEEAVMPSELTVKESRTSTIQCAGSDDALLVVNTAQRLVDLAKPVQELAEAQRDLLSLFCDRLGIDENLRPQSLARETEPSCAGPSDMFEQFSTVYQYQMDFLRLMNQMAEMDGSMEHSFKKNAQRDMLDQNITSRASASEPFYVDRGWEVQPDGKDALLTHSTVGHECSHGDAFEASLHSESSDDHQILVPHSVSSMEPQDTLLFQIEQELLGNSQQEVSFIVPPDCPPGTDVRFTHNRCTYKVTIGPDHFPGSQMHVRVGKPPPLSLRERKEIHDFVRVSGGPMQMHADLSMDGDLSNYNLLQTATSQRRLAAYHALQGQNMHPLLPDVQEDGESTASSLDGSRRSLDGAEPGTEQVASPSASSMAVVKTPALLDLSTPYTKSSEDPAFCGAVSPFVEDILTPAFSVNSLPTLTFAQEPCPADMTEPLAEPTSVPLPLAAPNRMHLPLAAPNSSHLPLSEPNSTHLPLAEPSSMHLPLTEPSCLQLPLAEPNSLHLPLSEPNSMEKLPLMQELSQQSTDGAFDEHQEYRDEHVDDAACEFLPDPSSLTIPFIGSRRHAPGGYEDEDAFIACNPPTHRRPHILAGVSFCSTRNSHGSEWVHSSDTIIFGASPSSHDTIPPQRSEHWESCVESLQSCDEARALSAASSCDEALALNAASSRMTVPSSSPSSSHRCAPTNDAGWLSCDDPPRGPTSTSSHASSSSKEERLRPQLEDPHALDDVDRLMGGASSRSAEGFEDSQNASNEMLASSADMHSSLASMDDEGEVEPVVSWLDDTVARGVVARASGGRKNHAEHSSCVPKFTSFCSLFNLTNSVWWKK
eukprot:GEMP01002329.1.p1 GENE.GEMP01002329.1~~GEMP01002329.1.p1  ORF type:complete len:1151 (+),score=238.69 GEMP01002329.1:230-3682(+)